MRDTHRKSLSSVMNKLNRATSNQKSVQCSVQKLLAIVPRMKNKKIVKLASRYMLTPIRITIQLTEILTKMPSGGSDNEPTLPNKTRKIFYPVFNNKKKSNEMDVENSNSSLEVQPNIQIRNKS